MLSIIRLALLAVGLTVLGCGDNRTITTTHDGGTGLPDACCPDDFAPTDNGLTLNCPSKRPVHNDLCSVVKRPCSYTQGCPCGPASLSWFCYCINGAWDCAPSGQCAPCADFGPDTSPCPPPMACNWCQGKHVKDSSGCTVGYVCANGVDPCSTQPCYQDNDCPPTDVCQADHLCWLALDAGAP